MGHVNGALPCMVGVVQFQVSTRMYTIFKLYISMRVAEQDQDKDIVFRDSL